MTDEPKIQPLTIHLARTPGSSETDLLNIKEGTKHRKIQINPNTLGDLYIQPPKSKPPDWAEFFDGFVNPIEFGENSSTSAALLVNTGIRIYALTFGTGRFLLNEDCWEDRFGLKVALNCIGENRVRSIDKHSLDQLLRHSSEQASRDATALEFGFDIEQDLLKGVTGKPTDKNFGVNITGADSLHINVPVHLNTLPELLENLHIKFLDTSYQKSFPWVDQIAEVRNASLEQQLDTLLLERINSGSTDRIWMAVPERITWKKVFKFRFPARGGTFEYQDIHLSHFLAARGSEVPINKYTLEAAKIDCVDQDGRKLHRWSAYRCLYAEIERDGKEFLLSGTRWYQVKSDFIDEVNIAYQKIPDFDGILPDYKDGSEREYLLRIAGSGSQKFALADKKLIEYGGGKSKVEFCDLFTDDNDLFHVKRYGQASALSHLFAQGVVSGEAFQMDEEFREAVNQILPSTHQLSDPSLRPAQGKFRVIYAIISDRPGPLRLPFFSRLNLKHAARRLEGYGFRVAKFKIPVDEAFGKIAKLSRKLLQK